MKTPGRRADSKNSAGEERVSRRPQADPAHILVVDDDKRIRALLSRFLVAEGYRVSSAATAAEAQARLAELVVDLIVLDVMMPGEDGMQFAARLRAGAAPLSQAPILMLSARSELQSRLQGLEAGVDDYLGKPFEPRELALRIASILRRTRAATPHASASDRIAHFGGFVFHLDAGVLLRDGAAIRLTTRERELLGTLACGRVISRRALAQRNDETEASERSVDVEIARLRRKLESAAHLLQTIRSQGYRLVLDSPGAATTGH
jgi:two-component system phosphate regulon response regulator OmpR